MFLAGIFSWWYGSGWLGRIKALRVRLESSLDFFSIGILASTLFAPYRQISAGRVDGPVNIMVRAFLDRTVSRMIGAMIRSFMIIFGLIAISLQFIFGLLMLALWLVFPTLPVVGLILMVVGWVPVWKF